MNTRAKNFINSYHNSSIGDETRLSYKSKNRKALTSLPLSLFPFYHSPSYLCPSLKLDYLIKIRTKKH